MREMDEDAYYDGKDDARAGLPPDPWKHGYAPGTGAANDYGSAYMMEKRRLEAIGNASG